ncbi:MAG TPA: SRPBCC family protein [Puia sp.]|nr:SRPBCC family protein [Puia sp.]
MKNKMTAEASITVDATAAQVWKALTTPALIKKYLMGTSVTSDWKENSPISYEGTYNGKKYHDKGVIKKMTPDKLFQSTYWSSVGGKEDKPENYNLVTYTLDSKGDQTTVTLTQDNVLSEKEKDHVTENWNAVLKKLKEVVENSVATPG